MNTIAIARNEPHQIGNFIGLLAAVLIVWIAYTVHQRWMRLHGEENPSPGSDPALLDGLKPQVGEGLKTKMSPSPAAPAPGDVDLVKFVEAVDGKARTKDVVLAARSRFGVSRATVLRALKKARGGS